MNTMVRERAHATGPDCSASMMAWVLFGGMSWFASMRYLPPRTPLSTQPHEANRPKAGRQGGRAGQGRAGEDAHPGIGDGSKVHGVVWELGGLVSVRVDGHLRADMQRVAALDPLRPRVLPRPYTHRVSALLLPNLPRGARGVRTCQGAQASSGMPCVAT